jgi:hypothetical protein
VRTRTNRKKLRGARAFGHSWRAPREQHRSRAPRQCVLPVRRGLIDARTHCAITARRVERSLQTESSGVIAHRGPKCEIVTRRCNSHRHCLSASPWSRPLLPRDGSFIGAPCLWCQQAEARRIDVSVGCHAAVSSAFSADEQHAPGGGYPTHLPGVVPLAEHGTVAAPVLLAAKGGTRTAISATRRVDSHSTSYCGRTSHDNYFGAISFPRLWSDNADIPDVANALRRRTTCLGETANGDWQRERRKGSRPDG